MILLLVLLNGWLCQLNLTSTSMFDLVKRTKGLFECSQALLDLKETKVTKEPKVFKGSLVHRWSPPWSSLKQWCICNVFLMRIKNPLSSYVLKLMDVPQWKSKRLNLTENTASFFCPITDQLSDWKDSSSFQSVIYQQVFTDLWPFQGPFGVPGPPGRPGLVGSLGVMQRLGLKGEDGDWGTAGPPGIEGKIGPQGVVGMKGVKGPKGEPVSVWSRLFCQT